MKKDYGRLDEFQIIQNVIQGNDDAFTYLYQKYKGLVFSVIYPIVKNTEESEDIMQDVFLKAYKFIINNQYDHSNKFSSWICKIAKNKGINEFRKKKVFSKHFILTTNYVVTNEKLFLEIPDTNKSIEDLFFESELRVLINITKRFESMPPGRSRIMKLRYLDDLKYQEIADYLQISLSTVKTEIHRSHKILKKILKKIINSQM